MTHTIDLFSDVICPWCFLGKRRLEKAIASHQEEVQVRWLPFEYPDAERRHLPS